MQLSAELNSELLRQLGLLELRARRSFLGQRQGGHVSPKRGQGIEFADHRAYERGDSPRWIDWGLYGRTDRFYVRRFQEEQNLTVSILIDSSASMRTPKDSKKWERAFEVAGGIAYISLLQRETTIVTTLGEATSGRLYGGEAAARLFRYLKDKQNTEVKELNLNQIYSALAQVKSPGLLYFVSDLLFEHKNFVEIGNLFLKKNLEATVIQILSEQDLELPQEEQGFLAIDSESQEEVEILADQETRDSYQLALKSHNQRVNQICLSRRIKYVQLRAEESLKEIFSKRLIAAEVFR
jgi:uncharacterized protein (DUF58 family)